MNKKAFTLAEILITLGIIGVVAAITIPSILQKQQKMIWVNRLKKEYSIVSQVVQKMMADDGVNTWGDTQFYNYLLNEDSDKLKSLAGEYFKANKICVSGESKCVPDKFAEYKFFDNGIASSGAFPIASLGDGCLLVFLANGSIIV